MCSQCLMSWELYFVSLRAEYVCKLLAIFLHGPLSLLPYLLFSSLFISVSTHGYLCYTLVQNQLLHYFVAQIVPALAPGSSFVCLQTEYPIIVTKPLPQFLSLQDALAYLVYFLPQSQNPSPQSSSSFYWKTVLETKVQVQGVLIATIRLSLEILKFLLRRYQEGDTGYLPIYYSVLPFSVCYPGCQNTEVLSFFLHFELFILC